MRSEAKGETVFDALSENQKALPKTWEGSSKMYPKCMVGKYRIEIHQQSVKHQMKLKACPRSRRDAKKITIFGI